jgi:pimeloyl-ACP methyl ester carboxylesterase
MLRHILDHNGQTLAYAEYGSPTGFPILAQHGLIASIKDGAAFSQLTGSGARLICAARPGYGQTAPYVLENIAAWGQLVSGLVDELRLVQFDVLGISSGAPYSYAIAHAFPDKVRQVFILSGTPALFDAQVQACWPYPLDPGASMPALQKLAYELFFAHLDPDALAADDIRDAMVNNCFGIAQDFKLRCADWGFNLAEIQTPVQMRHSRADESVPLISAQITARLLRNCQLEIREHDAHFTQAVLDDFILSTIASHYVPSASKDR